MNCCGFPLKAVRVGWRTVPASGALTRRGPAGRTRRSVSLAANEKKAAADGVASSVLSSEAENNGPLIYREAIKQTHDAVQPHGDAPYEDFGVGRFASAARHHHCRKLNVTFSANVAAQLSL